MAQVEMPNILGSFLQGQQAGEAQRRKRTLSDFLQPALGGDQNALAKVYSVDPDAGMQLQGMQQKQATADRETKAGQLKQLARAYRSAPESFRPHLYGQIVDLTEGLNLAPSGSLPRQHAPELDAAFNQFLSGISGDEQEQFTLSPGSARYDASGRQIVSQPFAPERPQFQVGADGSGYWIAPGQAPRPVDAPSIGSPSSNYQDQFASIAQRHGSAITSGVRPVLPGVGAGTNSQHPKGTAADFRTNGLPPQQVDAMMAELRSQGFEVIDERDNRNGRGPHIHAELPPGGLKFPTKGNASTEDKAANWQIVQGNDGQMYRVNKLTGQKEAVGVTGNNAARIQKMEQDRLEKVQGIEGSIAQTKTALDSIDSLLNAPGLDRAVGFGSMFPTAPGTDTANFEAQLDTFKAQTFVPMVAQLKGMGALSDAEGKKLSEAVGALNIKMSPTAFRSSLNNIKAVLRRAETAANRKISEINQAASGQYRGQPAPQQPAAGPAPGTIEAGYRFKGGNAGDPSNWEKV